MQQHQDRTADRYGFVQRPETRWLGVPSRGAAIVGGRLALDGVTLCGDPFGPNPELDAAALSELHGFRWLDDLAAIGTPEARSLGQTRVLGWLSRYPGGPPAEGWRRAPVWWPQTAGRRVLSWVSHGGMLLPGLDRSEAAPIFDALHADLAHLMRHAQAAPPGAARIEAMAGAAIAAMSLRGAEGDIAPALAALAEAAPDAFHTRRPEGLLERTALLVWAAELADEGGHPLPGAIRATLNSALPVLRGLRHADGGLPRAHGGGAGVPGRLDHVLRAGGRIAARVAEGQALGFGRIARGRTTVICDLAPPPRGPLGHAGALGFEVTVGEHPLVVACGSGRRLPAPWPEASRATAAHSSLVLDNCSLTRLRPDGALQPVSVVAAPAVPGQLAGWHDGWLASHGVQHHRSLRLSDDGLSLLGEDQLLSAAGTQDGHDLQVTLHFHLHPHILAHLIGPAEGVTLTLPTGTAWQFRSASDAPLALEASAWVEPGHPGPLATQQITLRTSVGRMPVSWSFAQV
ncbi:heparinase [Paracoccus suum]|uniref:Heparinase n=1 Tax=Paracoccus suum TaxID=2259340 RepID=A0A344PIG0_9RHOB|nr:heparinase II/III family protein [Paracoccus suum]AXC49165.1 heparinase [Paracoccus suum]